MQIEALSFWGSRREGPQKEGVYEVGLGSLLHGFLGVFQVCGAKCPDVMTATVSLKSTAAPAEKSAEGTAFRGEDVVAQVHGIRGEKYFKISAIVCRLDQAAVFVRNNDTAIFEGDGCRFLGGGDFECDCHKSLSFHCAGKGD